MKIIRYVTFTSKTVYDSAEGYTWEKIPNDDIQGIVVFYDGLYELGKEKYHYRTLYHGRDSYISDGDQLFAQNDDSKLVNEERYSDCIVKLGKWTSSTKWDSVYKDMWALTMGEQ